MGRAMVPACRRLPRGRVAMSARRVATDRRRYLTVEAQRAQRDPALSEPDHIGDHMSDKQIPASQPVDSDEPDDRTDRRATPTRARPPGQRRQPRQHGEGRATRIASPAREQPPDGPPIAQGRGIRTSRPGPSRPSTRRPPACQPLRLASAGSAGMSAIAARTALTSNGVSPGCADRMRATSPAMCGAAKLLPVATVAAAVLPGDRHVDAPRAELDRRARVVVDSATGRGPRAPRPR